MIQEVWGLGSVARIAREDIRDKLLPGPAAVETQACCHL